MVGGLYWRRGTTQAAWVGTIVGSTTALVGIFFFGNKSYWAAISSFANSTLGLGLPATYPYNYMETMFAVALLTLSSMSSCPW